MTAESGGRDCGGAIFQLGIIEQDWGKENHSFWGVKVQDERYKVGDILEEYWDHDICGHAMIVKVNGKTIFQDSPELREQETKRVANWTEMRRQQIIKKL